MFRSPSPWRLLSGYQQTSTRQATWSPRTRLAPWPAWTRLTLWPALLALVACGCACDEEPSPAPQAVASAASTNRADTLEPTEADKPELARLQALADEKTWRFPGNEEREPKNTRSFLLLATQATAPHVIAAALSGLAALTAPHAPARLTPGAEFVSVVAKHFDHAHPRVVGRALDAARSMVTGKDPEGKMRDRLILASREPRFAGGPARYALLQALRSVEMQQRNPNWVQTLQDSIKAPEPHVIASALQLLVQALPRVRDREALFAQGLQLLSHPDFAVQGRALELLGALGRKPNLSEIQQIYAALESPNAHVRSEACAALSRLRHQPAIHHIARLLDDTATNVFDYPDVPTLEGSSERLVFNASAWGTVQDAAAAAMRSLAFGRLKLENVNPKQVREGLTRNAQTAKAWYKKEKANLATDASAASNGKPLPSGKAASGASSPKAAPDTSGG